MRFPLDVFIVDLRCYFLGSVGVLAKTGPEGPTDLPEAQKGLFVVCALWAWCLSARAERYSRPHSPAGGGEICHLWVQNGHFPYIFEGLIADSKSQKDAHLKMRSIGTE